MYEVLEMFIVDLLVRGVKTILELNGCSDRFLNNFNRKFYFGHLPVT